MSCIFAMSSLEMRSPTHIRMTRVTNKYTYGPCEPIKEDSTRNVGHCNGNFGICSVLMGLGLHLKEMIMEG